MFDLLPMLLSSVASFLFPIFASYKALKTSDPAQLTPWLMYWVVFSCCLLAESWVSFILVWIPFYGYIRLLFLLYLILPQTQGARELYERYVHPFLEDNEGHIDEFIASAHERLKTAGIAYLKNAIEYIKTKVLGLPPTEPTPPTPEPTGPQSYTQSLLARFSVPTARWTGSATAGTDIYSILAGAVAAASGVAAGNASGGSIPRDRLIPSDLKSSGEKMSFIEIQRERLNTLLSALDQEALALQNQAAERPSSMSMDGGDGEPTQRVGGGIWGGLNKSRSEADFEKIEAESGAEDESSIRKRNTPGSKAGSWVPWGWGAGSEPGTSSGVDK
ncbi:unnamed protein product [Clonostachys rhizophaga]|uniref:Protein YOP1 n=1 Tax=Clonostachys rhizophaga TaxID=160324 RepID=A0A9N9V0H8_9HYPO|nr:unnamed protein product [Clonostachys rhizophaga]